MAQRSITFEEISEAREHAYDIDDGKGPYPPYTKKRWWAYRRKFEDGRVLYLFTKGSGMSIGVSSNDQDCGYRDIYDYFHNPAAAWSSALGWDGEGEPDNWTRAKRFGDPEFRRRDDGDPSKEYTRE